MSRARLAIAVVGAGCAFAALLAWRRRKRALHFYPIGTAGVAWGARERAAWLARAGCCIPAD